MRHCHLHNEAVVWYGPINHIVELCRVQICWCLPSVDGIVVLCPRDVVMKQLTKWDWCSRSNIYHYLFDCCRTKGVCSQSSCLCALWRYGSNVRWWTFSWGNQLHVRGELNNAALLHISWSCMLHKLNIGCAISLSIIYAAIWHHMFII